MVLICSSKRKIKNICQNVKLEFCIRLLLIQYNKHIVDSVEDNFPGVRVLVYIKLRQLV